MSETDVQWHAVGDKADLFAVPTADKRDAVHLTERANESAAEGVCARSCASVKVAGVQVALFDVDGRVYAMDDRCTHGNAFLSEGELDGFQVECPMHAGVFDVRTGAVLGSPATRAARCHGVKVEGGAVFIRITPRA